MTWLILLLTFAAAAVSSYLMVVPSGETALVRSRAASIRRSPGLRRTAEGTVVNEEMELPFAQRVLGPTLDRFYQMILRRTPARVQVNMQLRLIQGGNPMAASHFVGLQTMCASSLVAVGVLLSSPFLGRKPLMAALLLTVLLVVGWRAPDFWLSRMISQRRNLIDKALPDVLDLLSVSVEAGLGLDGAIQKVGEKFPDPIAGEFRELLKSIRLGTPRADALRTLADRTVLPDVRTFTAAVIQAEQLGVAISRVLRAQAEALRVKRKQKVQERAMALPLKMLFPLILFIFPTIFIVVLGPVVINFMNTMMK